jgi:PAS domain S-box-containing protein
MESGANRERLRDVLTPRYAVVVPDDGFDPDEAFDDRFDLCILDDRSLARHADALDRHKRRVRPTFVPYVLLTNRPASDSVPARVWRQVDDVLHKPLTVAALHSRLTSHVQTRTLSIQFARSEARFTALIRTATDAVFILDRDATIAFVNPAVEEVLGYEPRELVGEPVTTLIPEASREAASAGIAEAFAAGEVGATATIEARALHRDGHKLPVRLSYNLFRSDGTVWLAGIVHDVTDLTRREQRLRVLNRVLRHDIRNDVNVIQGWAERLRRSGENVPRYTTYIEEKAEEIVHLSDQARRVEQLSASGDDALSDVDLVGRLTDQLGRFRQANPDVTLSADVPGRADVIAHPLVDSAVDNVLENAVEHNDADRPSVDVRLSETETNEFELRIADDGPGIPAEELAALETGDEGPLTHTSGLGLWLTKWIVAASGGTVRFAENEPTGTVVSMRFTRAEGQPEDD